MEITKREIIASISILAIMLIIGFYISGKISEHHQDENSIYNKAMKIKQQDIFEYSMKTNVGNAFVEGELIALNPVTYDKLKGGFDKLFFYCVVKFIAFKNEPLAIFIGL